MKHWHLSAKLTAWSALIVGLSVLACAIGTGVFLRHEQLEMLDNQLKREARHFFAAWEHRSDQSFEQKLANVEQFLPVTSSKQFVEILDDNRRVLHRSKDLPVRDLPSPRLVVDTVRLPEQCYRLATFRKDGLELRLAANIHEIESDAAERAVAVLPALPVLLGLTVFGGWWIARKALDPVNSIAASAEQITAERLDRRLPVPRVEDEIGRLTRVLNEMFDRLDQSFRQAVRFSADASHELKTPLTVLRNSIEDLLESTTLSEADRVAVEGLLEQTFRLSSITDSLLLLSRADCGRLQLDLQPADVMELIAACVEDARIQAAPRGIDIKARLLPSLRGSVDIGRLSQVLLNLLGNAIKFNVDRGQVTVTAGREENDDLLWIVIGNTGPGISPEEAPHIFERFFRSDTQRDVPGHGLGLSLARELARAHGGDLQLARSEDGWTQFRLTIAVQEEDSARKARRREVASRNDR
jgi:two-component system, OmpR family, heavy metal sensor histidine kinase CusS